MATPDNDSRRLRLVDDQQDQLAEAPDDGGLTVKQAAASRIAQHGRRGALGYRSRLFGREAMYRRSLALRAAVADGGDDERIARALASVDEAQMALL
jgi:hypothetical protein